MESASSNNEPEVRVSFTLPKSISVWICFGVAALAILAALGYIIGHTQEQQRNLVPTMTVRAMNACLLLGFVGLAAIWARLRAVLTRKMILTSVGFLIGGYLICGLAPKTNRIFFDEHIYMQIGQSIAHTGRAEAANYARAEYGSFEIYNAWVNKQPNGHPYVLGLLYRITGVSSDVSFFVNRAWVGIAAAALYLGLALVPWALPRGSAAWAGALYCLTPLVIWWGHTVAVEPGAAGSAAVAFCAACIFARLYDFSGQRKQTPIDGFFLAGAVAFACYFRPESLLVYGMAAGVLWASDRRLAMNANILALFAVAFVLTVPELMHVWSMHTEDWGARDGRRFASDFIPANLTSNGGYFVDSHWFPIAGTVFLVAGLIYLFRYRSSSALSLLVWLLPAWGIFVLFYAGGYHYGASSRYGVVSCPPIAVGMGIGAASLWQLLRSRPAWLALVFSGCGLNWLAAMHYVPSITRESAEARADVDFVHRVAPTLPEGSLIVSCNPCMWTIEGRNSSQFFTIEDMMRNQMIELRNQYPGGIYIHWNFWDNVEPSLAADARALIHDTAAQTIVSTTSQDHYMAILRADTPTAIAKFGGSSKPDTHIQRIDAPSPDNSHPHP